MSQRRSTVINTETTFQLLKDSSIPKPIQWIKWVTQTLLRSKPTSSTSRSQVNDLGKTHPIQEGLGRNRNQALRLAKGWFSNRANVHPTLAKYGVARQKRRYWFYFVMIFLANSDLWLLIILYILFLWFFLLHYGGLLWYELKHIRQAVMVCIFLISLEFESQLHRLWMHCWALFAIKSFCLLRKWWSITLELWSISFLAKHAFEINIWLLRVFLLILLNLSIYLASKHVRFVCFSLTDRK